MTTLVLGATGATGKRLVSQLLERGEAVRAVVRAADRLPADLREDSRLAVTEASLLEMSHDQLAELVAGCRAVASCLGHNLSVRGIWGRPRRLVTEAARRVCRAIRAGDPAEPVRLVWMSSAGVRNRDRDEPVSAAQAAVLQLLRTLIPPHADNEQTAEFLRTEIGPDDAAIRWVLVRPDSLTEADEPSEYDVHASPTRSAIFNAGKTSRANVAHFMAELATGEERWQKWQGRMPVLYNRE